MPTQQQLLDRIAPTLDPGEQVFALVLGQVGDDKFNSIVALTSKRLLFAGPARGSSVHLGNIKAITWSNLWSSLNIDLRQPPLKRIVIAGSGSEWKRDARRLLEEARSLMTDSGK